MKAQPSVDRTALGNEQLLLTALEVEKSLIITMEVAEVVSQRLKSY